jgi:hypothetical protein
VKWHGFGVEQECHDIRVAEVPAAAVKAVPVDHAMAWQPLWSQMERPPDAARHTRFTERPRDGAVDGDAADGDALNNREDTSEKLRLRGYKPRHEVVDTGGQ